MIFVIVGPPLSRLQGSNYTSELSYAMLLFSALLSPYVSRWTFLHKRTGTFLGVLGPHGEVGVFSLNTKALLEGDAETPQHGLFGFAHRHRPIRGNLARQRFGPGHDLVCWHDVIHQANPIRFLRAHVFPYQDYLHSFT